VLRARAVAPLARERPRTYRGPMRPQVRQARPRLPGGST
jgi:hypothetical protein